MISRTAVSREARHGRARRRRDCAANRPGPVSLLLLSAWCGLVAGLLEVGTIVLRKQMFDPNHLYGMSRHFVWLIPLTNLCVFLALGALGCVVGLAWPRRGRWLLIACLCALALLPMLLVAFPRIYSLAWLVVALGVAARLVPLLERNARVFRRFVRVSFPLALGIVGDPGGITLGRRPDQAIAREGARPLPPPGSPNVLLIVLDTVAAGHLSLHGYDRPTSTTLVELAERGIRFDSAQAGLVMDAAISCDACLQDDGCTSSRSAGSLRSTRRHPTLAEFLGDRGYATAGFVANTSYCASDSGLGRGFTHYQDYIFPELTAFKTAVLVSRALAGIQAIVRFLWRIGWTFARLRSRLCDASGSRWTPIARERRWSIASSSTGSRGGRSRSGRFSPS